MFICLKSGVSDSDIIEPVMKNKKLYSFNPYPMLGAPSSPITWPRGFPLDSILNPNTSPGNYITCKFDFQPTLN
jgi:hypothetical protein